MVRKYKIVQNDQVAGFLETLTGVDELLIRDHLLQDFDGDKIFWEEGCHIAEQQVLREIHKAAFAAGERFETDCKKTIVQGRSRSVIAIQAGVEVVEPERKRSSNRRRFAACQRSVVLLRRFPCTGTWMHLDC